MQASLLSLTRDFLWGECRGKLWFVFKGCDSAVELVGDSLQIAVAVLNDDGYIQLLPLKGGMRSTNGKAVRIGSLLEPTYKQSIAASLAMVGRIAVVKQHVLVFGEELIEDDERNGADVRVVRRANVVNLRNGKLIGIATADGILGQEADTVEYAALGAELVATTGFADLVRRFGVDALERQLDQSITTLTSLPLNSASSSFFHSCLCFTAALINSRACSFVFLTSIIVVIYP